MKLTNYDIAKVQSLLNIPDIKEEEREYKSIYNKGYNAAKRANRAVESLLKRRIKSLEEEIKWLKQDIKMLSRK